MGTLTRFLVGLLLHGYIAEPLAQGKLCTPANKRLCWDASDVKPLPNLPNVTWSQLMHYCRRYPEVRNCQKQMSPNCSKETQMVYEGLDNEHRFMCEDEGKDYAQHMACLSLVDLQRAEADCYGEYRIREAEVFRTDSISFIARFCQHTDTYIDCTKNAVKSYCGKEASSWTVELNERSLTPLMVHFQCQDWPRRPVAPTTTNPPDTNKTYLLIGASSAGVVVVAVLVIVLFVVVRRRRGRVNDAENRQKSVGTRGNDRRTARGGGNRSNSHMITDDQSRVSNQGRVSGTAEPNHREGGLVSRRATASVVHKQPLTTGLRSPPVSQTSLAETFDRSQSAFAPRGQGKEEAYQQLSPVAESTYQHLKSGGDGATYMELAPTTKGTNGQRATVTGSGDRRQPMTQQNESKDNIYQELL